MLRNTIYFSKKNWLQQMEVKKFTTLTTMLRILCICVFFCYIINPRISFLNVLPQHWEAFRSFLWQLIISTMFLKSSNLLFQEKHSWIINKNFDSYFKILYIKIVCKFSPFLILFPHWASFRLLGITFFWHELLCR